MGVEETKGCWRYRDPNLVGVAEYQGLWTWLETKACWCGYYPRVDGKIRKPRLVGLVRNQGLWTFKETKAHGCGRKQRFVGVLRNQGLWVE